LFNYVSDYQQLDASTVRELDFPLQWNQRCIKLSGKVTSIFILTNIRINIRQLSRNVQENCYSIHHFRPTHFATIYFTKITAPKNIINGLSKAQLSQHQVSDTSPLNVFLLSSVSCSKRWLSWTGWIYDVSQVLYDWNNNAFSNTSYFFTKRLYKVGRTLTVNWQAFWQIEKKGLSTKHLWKDKSVGYLSFENT